MSRSSPRHTLNNALSRVLLARTDAWSWISFDEPADLPTAFQGRPCFRGGLTPPRRPRSHGSTRRCREPRGSGPTAAVHRACRDRRRRGALSLPARPSLSPVHRPSHQVHDSAAGSARCSFTRLSGCSSSDLRDPRAPREAQQASRRAGSVSARRPRRTAWPRKSHRSVLKCFFPAIHPPSGVARECVFQ